MASSAGARSRASKIPGATPTPYHIERQNCGASRRIWSLGPRGRSRQRVYGGEQVAYLPLGDVAGDENDAAGAVVVRPAFQLDRRMREMLDVLNHHRATAAGDVEQSLDAQQVGAA